MPAINEQHQAFITQCIPIIANTKSIAASLAPNTVQVWPGGAVFTGIQAAIDSITGASQDEQYQVAVGSGTYKENIVMKDYVYVIGAEQSLTTITAPAKASDPPAVVNSASGCGISELTINAPGGEANVAPAGIKICGTGFFHISGVTINSGTAGSKTNDVKGIHNMYGSPSGDVIIGSSMININGAGGEGIGINLFGVTGSAPLNVTIELSTIRVNPGPQGCYGVTAATSAAVVLNESTITASTYALDNDGSGSPITANQCTINGPVSKNVVVNP